MGVGGKDLGLTFISMVCDDNIVFQGADVGVITQMKETIVGVYYFAHWMNLAMLVLSKLNLVTRLEVLL